MAIAPLNSNETDYDCILVGGGHNNLTAAGYLAKAGLKILVLEQNDFIGGGLISREVTAPGFIHELHAIAMFLIHGNPLLKHDELELYARHGLEPVFIDGPYFTSVFDDGEVIASYFDLEKTVDSMAHLSPKDADTYRRLSLKNGRLLNLILKGMFTPPLSMGALLKLLEGSEDGNYFTRLMFSSAVDFIQQHFSNEYIQCHLYKWVSENLVSPDEVGSGLISLLLLGMAHVVPAGVFRGGNQNLAHALARAITAMEGEIRTGAEVGKILHQHGRVRGVELKNGERIWARQCVITATPVWDLPQLIDGLEVSALGDIQGLKPSGYSIFLCHYALHEAPRFKVDEHHNSSFVIECMRKDLNAYRACYDQFKYGSLPTLFSGHSVCATHYDRSRAPDDKHSLYFYHYVPNIPAGKQLHDWPAMEEPFADWMLEGLRSYTTNMGNDNIIARSLESPYAMHQHSPSFRNGECFGLAMTSRQFMAQRPTPELGQYRVPGIEGLYLCGPSQHPGGGCIGGGRPVAMRIMMDKGMDLYPTFPAL